MRINAYIAQITGMSRRGADLAIQSGRINVNDKAARLGQKIAATDKVMLDGVVIKPPAKIMTVIFNKPTGYVCSRNGQGNRTVYGLLPDEYKHLKTVGRLDKDSSGLILLTNDGKLAERLTHPRYRKQKVYEVTLEKPLLQEHKLAIEQGVRLTDGISKLHLSSMDAGGLNWQITMSEGRNRQIRRTFSALNYRIKNLHRTRFGIYELGNIQTGMWLVCK